MTKRPLPKLSPHGTGTDDAGITPGMRAALAARGKRTGPPTDEDAPPLSTFPMTPAAREALRMSRMSREWEL